jgi:asparagine synthase (glutamine-hydrolysing)
MACGLELRSPFLDHQLVEFCARIPSSWKVRGWKQKYILRRAFANELPGKVLARGKAGFGLPLADWLRGELKDLARETLLSPGASIAGWLHTEKVRMMLDQHAAGQHNWHIQLWRLLVLENWLQAAARPDVPADFENVVPRSGVAHAN